MNVDPNDLLALLALARTRTHLAAGVSLGVNHTTIARRVRRLETKLGCRLVVPSGEGWTLTPAGKETLRSAEHIERALADAAGVEVTATDSGPHGLVRVNATEVFGILVAAPALSTVCAQYPGITVELTFYVRLTATAGAPFDIDVGIVKPRSPHLKVRKLPDCRFGLYAGKPYLANRPAPISLADLTGHTSLYFIGAFPAPHYDASSDITNWLSTSGVQLIGATSVFAQMEMIRHGAGLGNLPVYLAEQQDDLVRLLPDEVEFSFTYWLSVRDENFERPEVQLVQKALEQQAHAILDH
jgi:DNA-binding transcriptional LysR family regulator